MSKTTKFSELRAKVRPEARAEARRLADKDHKEMPLHELRAARHLTQQQLARTLDMTQAAVSQLSSVPACSGRFEGPMPSSPYGAAISTAGLRIIGKRAGPEFHFICRAPM